jgi:hypothetical protein
MPMTNDCSFCHGQPIGNARRWTDPSAPEHAPCPRCGMIGDKPGPEPRVKPLPPYRPK